MDLIKIARQGVWEAFKAAVPRAILIILISAYYLFNLVSTYIDTYK